ncbi:hypothetical protein ACFOWZ_20230 [Lentzea rhizosphaerae]|uniref:Uncharacterized protein n=1 Tax=Lentzea rhizosphaerae TaxID=2041025 RepID=A0ABV8BV99_9PSEU
MSISGGRRNRARSGGREPLGRHQATLELILKFAAAPGIILFATLFIAYRRYYATLGVTPEDVGITNAYVLSRSVGLVLLVLLFVAITALSSFIERRESGFGRGRPSGSGLNRLLSKVWAVLPLILRAFLTAVTGLLLARLYPRTVHYVILIFVLILVGVITLTSDRFYDRFGSFGRTFRLFVTALAGAIVLATALNSFAHYQANGRALRGCSVEPFDFYGLTILDISADYARIDWIGPPQQAPAMFVESSGQRSVHGLVVGRGSTLSFVKRVEGQVVVLQVPAALVTTESDPKTPKDLDEAATASCKPSR